jgi:hypothetical protein
MSPSEFLIVLSLLGAGLAIMAVYLAARNFGWFSLCPQIDDDGERLVAHTARLPWLLSLTLWYRAVTADRQQREVIVSHLIAWIWPRTQRIAFDEIAAVLYHFEEGSLTVALRLHSGEVVHLFYFWGPFDDSGSDSSTNDEEEYGLFDPEGHTSRRGWHIPWGLVFEQPDYSERTALAFAERLQEMTGAPLAA